MRRIAHPRGDPERDLPVCFADSAGKRTVEHKAVLLSFLVRPVRTSLASVGGKTADPPPTFIVSSLCFSHTIAARKSPDHKTYQRQET